MQNSHAAKSRTLWTGMLYRFLWNQTSCIKRLKGASRKHEEKELKIALSLPASHILHDIL